jgi:hypothetical protein
MYDEKDIKEVIKEVAKLLFEEIIDKTRSLKVICKLLKQNIYLNLSAVEWVRFYEQFWVVYTIVLGIAFWFFKLAELEDNRIKWEIINLIIVGSFIGYKLWWKINKERKGEVSRKYTQENVTKQWFLRAEYIKCRQFYFWCIIFWMLIFALMVKISSLKREYFYPAFFMIIYCEMWLRYAWLTKEEYYETKFQIEPQNENIRTLVMIQRELRKKMPKDSYIGRWAKRGKKQSISEEEMNSILQRYFHEGILLREFLYKKQDILNRGSDLLESGLELLKGRSVLFKTPFYKDMDYAFLFTAYLKLIRGQRILLVCTPNTDLTDILYWMRDEIKKINGSDWWTFEAYRPFCIPGNVSALCYTDFTTFINDNNCTDFRDKLGLILLQEPSEYTKNCYRQIDNLFSQKKNINELCIAVVSSTIEALDLISKDAADDVICKGQLWTSTKNIQVMYWKEEMLDIGGNQGQGWGIEAELLQYFIEVVKAKKIAWIGGGRIPVWDILWDYKGTYDIDIGEQIIPEEYGYGLQLNEEIYIISEDFQGNYRKTAELLASRGTDKTMVHVIVPGYLLRDYISAYPENILLQEGITKKETVSERNIVYNILEELLEGWVSDEWIKTRLTIVCNYRGELDQILKELLRKYLLEGEVKLEKKVGKKVYYHVRTDSQIEKMKKKNVMIRFFGEDEDEVCNINTGLTYDTIFQKYLPGQNLIVRNKGYQFLGIIEIDGIYLAKIKRSLSAINEKAYYRQMREYKLEKEHVLNSPIVYNPDISDMKWLYGEADITVKTNAYFSMRTFRDVDHAVKFVCKDIPARKYKRKRYIKILLANKTKSNARMIGTWIKEALYTLCPKDVDYIAIGIRGCKDSISIDNVEADESTKPELETVYIIEDHNWDSGILQDMFEKQEEIIKMMKEFMDEVNPNEIKPFWQNIR